MRLSFGQIGVLQEQRGEFLFVAHECSHVVLDRQTGMRHGPKMSCPDECKKCDQIFKAFAAQSLAQRIPCALGLSRLDKDHRRSRKYTSSSSLSNQANRSAS